MGSIKKEVLTEPINTVYLNDFGDLYHELDEDKEFNELERRARSLKKRYRNIIDFNEAVATFYEYLIYLNSKYHVKEDIFVLMLEAGQIKEFVPAYPKLKGSRITKQLLKANTLEGRGTGRILDYDELENFIVTQDFDYTQQYTRIDYELKTVSPKFQKKMAEVIPDISQKSFKRDIRKMSDIDFLDEYFKAKKLMSKKKSKVSDTNTDDELTFEDIYYGNYEIVDEVKEDSMIWYEGSLVNKEELSDIKTMRYIKELGWNPLRLLTGKGISPVEDGKTVENKDVDPTIAAILKRHDKMEKKRTKKKKKNDDFLARVMTDNGYDTYSDFEADMFDLGAPDSARDGRFE